MRLTLDEAIATVPPLPAAYVLLGADGKYLYKGSCRNLQERLKDHRAGRAARTKNRRPLLLVHFEHAATFSAAAAIEKFFKTGAGRDRLQALMHS
jgi:putative endonuclease